MKRILIVLLGAAIAAGVAAQSKKEAAKKPEAKAEKAVEKKAAEPQKAEGQAFENANAMCVGCHGIPGYKTAFPDVYHVPKIAGQQPQYIVNALKAYKSGERSHPSMRGIAAALTDADMQKLADYYGGAK
jgi:cytochrome c553